MSNKQPIELIIRSNRSWVDFRLGEIWQYQDLLLLLVRRDFVAKYKQTILGPVWFVIQPLLMTSVFALVFTGIARLPTDGFPPTLFYLAGLLGWNYLAQSFQHSAGALIANAHIFGKVYFPRLVVPLSALVSNFLTFLLQAATFSLFWLYFKLSIPGDGRLVLTSSLFLLPLALLQLAAISLGIGLILASLTVKYRDLNFLVPFFIQIWMYLTPVIYPLSAVPPQWRNAVILNPAAVPVEGMRSILLGFGSIQAGDILISVAVTSLLLVIGVAAFNRVERTFVDSI